MSDSIKPTVSKEDTFDKLEIRVERVISVINLNKFFDDLFGLVSKVLDMVHKPIINPKIGGNLNISIN